MQFKPTSDHVRISGRCTRYEDILYLGFSGSFIEFTMQGTKLTVTFVTDDPVMREDPKSEWYRPEVSYCDDTYYGQVAILLDGNKEIHERIALTSPRMTRQIQLSDKEEMHTVRIVKLNEAAFGQVGIDELETDTQAPVLPTKPLDRRIEFVGDSITCGYGNEGVNEVDIYSTHQQNPLDAYAILTADALKAEYQLVSWSGIGIITNYIPETEDEPREEILMPQLYPYRDRRFNERKGLPLTEWDFSQYQPHVIVMFLGTNDASYTRRKPEREAYFGGEFEKFLGTLHEKNPESAILCILGTMEESLCDEEQKRVDSFAAAHPEVQIEFLRLPLQDNADGIGTDGHPSKTTHAKVAKLVSDKLKSMMKW